jgi:hypothetical protein
MSATMLHMSEDHDIAPRNKQDISWKVTIEMEIPDRADLTNNQVSNE